MAQPPRPPARYPAGAGGAAWTLLLTGWAATMARAATQLAAASPTPAVTVSPSATPTEAGLNPNRPSGGSPPP
jgi:hypothetical protein